MSHAYSIIAAFSMTDAAGTVHRCLLVRNPWGSSYYTGPWNKDDTDWTDDLVAQVPHGIDPRTDQASQGVFVLPTSMLIGQDCIADIQIGHERSAEGYTDTWFDQEDAVDAQTYSYTFDVDSSVNSDYYFMVETYAHEIVPTVCTTGYISTGQGVNYPVNLFQVYNGD